MSLLGTLSVPQGRQLCTARRRQHGIKSAHTKRKRERGSYLRASRGRQEEEQQLSEEEEVEYIVEGSSEGEELEEGQLEQGEQGDGQLETGEEAGLQQGHEHQNKHQLNADHEQQEVYYAQEAFHFIEPLQPSAYSIITPGGVLLAAAVLLAARLSRLQTRWEMFDRAATTARMEEEWQQRALREGRGTGGPASGPEVNPAVTARIEAARQRAQQLAEEREAQARGKLEEEEREIARIRAQRDAKFIAFNEEEARLARELADRTKRELEVIEEGRRRVAAEAQQRQMEAEAAERRLQEERERIAAEEAAIIAAEQQRLLEERKRLRAMETVFAVRLSGVVAVLTLPQGTTVGERVKKPAKLCLACSLSSPLTSSPQLVKENFPGTEEALDRVWSIAAASSHQAAKAHLGGIRLQAVGGQGALTSMEELEAEHWLRGAAVRAASEAAGRLLSLVDGFKEGGSSQEASVQVRTPVGVLPRDHPQRLTARLASVAEQCRQGAEVEAAAELASLLADQEERLQEDAPPSLPKHSGRALTAAAFLQHVAEEENREAGSGSSLGAESSVLDESALRIVKGLLREATAAAPKDSLKPLATVVSAVLPTENPVGPALDSLAEANLSQQARSTREQRRRKEQAELAAALVEEEWPADSETAAASAKAREALTPVAERVWALRNVGATLALGDPGELARARQLLERAVLVKTEWVGKARHPGTLPELVQLRGVLEAVPEWGAAASAVAGRVFSLLRDVAERYAACGEEVSACAVLEAALKDSEERLGLRHPAIRAAEDRAESLLESLPPEAKSRVIAARREGGTLASVLTAFSEEPAARSAAGVATEKSLLWDKGGLPPLQPMA